MGGESENYAFEVLHIVGFLAIAALLAMSESWLAAGAAVVMTFGSLHTVFV